jgi:hypothetical protein
MPSRTASCSCGQLHIQVEGEPRGVGLCHCLACQQRTGSVFATLASFSAPFKVFGTATEYIAPAIREPGSGFGSARFVGLPSSTPKKVTMILWVSQLVPSLIPPSQRLKFRSMTAAGTRGFSCRQA